MVRENGAVELREAAELFRTTVENLPINLVLYDRSYRILYMNRMLARTCATVYGRKPEDLVGLRGPELWPEAIWEPLLAHTERAIATRERQTYELTTDLPGHGHSVREWTVVPLVGSSGEVDQIVTMSTDVTAQRRMLEELRVADQRKSEFIAILSHELRNPLAAIRLSLQVLEEAPERDTATDLRSIIDRQVGQLVHLVDDLLDVTRITQKKIRLQRIRLDLSELVRATVEDNRRHFEKGGVRVEARLADAPIYVDADAVRIAQVLTNLLANAVKFTPAGGTATVAVGSDASGTAILRVSDTGAGIQPRLLPRLFEPFMQDNRATAHAGSGLGLGLALVKGLVELHGGSVSASSAGEGQGSTFEVRLPVDLQAPVEVPPDVTHAASDRTHRLLVVEDDEDIAAAMRMVLEMAGHRVKVVKTGRDAIAVAHGFVPELVLCDIGLPDMDGHEVARALRADETLRSTFLVALSGYAQAEDVERARAAGFDEHLAKPPNMQKVQRLLATLG